MDLSKVLLFLGGLALVVLPSYVQGTDELRPIGIAMLVAAGGIHTAQAVMNRKS